MAKIKAIVLRAPGSNCDGETAFAFERAGAETALVHVNRLLEGDARLGDYRILAIPGGFTYGDDIAAGKVLANELRLKLGDDILRFVEAGGLIIGICNGFQVMVKAGILPEPGQESIPRVTLTGNDSGKFECRWVHLQVNPDSPCVFLRGIEQMYLPVAHGEGKFAADPEVLPRVNVAVSYIDEKGDASPGYPCNPNGSVNDIAGISDASGRIFALMPHPERHIRGTQHPQWTRLGAQRRGDGMKIFQNAVRWAKEL
jgi:phosphoribosylformylglycinamidine synthase subunit PurQ / glutaminase